jgi:hypothetical protein
MKETIFDIIKEAGIIASISAVFFYALKKWLAKYIDSKFSENAELKKALLEIEKERMKKYEEKKDFIYPEILELVYRLKNQMQDIIKNAYKDIESIAPTSYFCCGEIGQELYFLTENLYKYRAYIDDDTFNNLHRYKRILQDAKILLNSITRPDYPIDYSNRAESVNIERNRYLSSLPELKTILKEVEDLHGVINKQIKKHLEIKLRK